MKKGLLTVLLASLVLVGCQNYDDQFDDLNAQISALKSQVDGLSSLSGQVSSLSGSISGLSAGVAAAQAAASSANSAASAIDLTGLSASLATLQAEVDAVQASLATAATASAVAALQTEIDAIEADVDELLATSNVYANNLTITSSSQLDAAVALGNNINIVNGTVTITQSSTMDATKLQTVIDKIFTVTGNYVYSAANTNVTAMTFDQLASTGDLTLKVNGPVSAKGLVTAGTLTLDDSYISKVTAINLDALTSVTEIQTDSGTDNIVFTSATSVDLGSLAVYPGAGSDYGLTITTKKGATLDIGSLDDVKSDGTAADVDLVISGPKDVSISNMSAWGGSISATDVENLTLSGFKGLITVNSGVENLTITDAEQFTLSSASGLKTVSLDVDKISDADATATVKAVAAYGAAVTGYSGTTPALEFSSMTNLTSVSLTGFFRDLTFTGLPNLTSIDIDATFEDLKVYNSDGLTSVDVTGSEFGNVWVEGNDALTALDLDHTSDTNFYGTTADRTYLTYKVTDNDELLSLTTSSDKYMTFNVTSNAKLATVNFTGVATFGTATTTVNPTVDVYSNALVASLASDTDDGLTQYAVDGTNDASDLGSFTTTSGMGTLKTYLTAVQANASSDADVHFDTVSLHNIASDAAKSTETAGDQNSGNALTYATDGGSKTNWVGAVYTNTKSSLATTNSTQYDAVKGKYAWLVDGNTSLRLQVSTIDVFANAAGTFGAITLTGDNTVDVNLLKTTLATSRATDLGVTLDVKAEGTPTMPAIVFSSAVTSATGGNQENYTNGSANTLSYTVGKAGASVSALVTTYDTFTLTYGNDSVTASITGMSATGSLTGAVAATAIATTLDAAWDAKYSMGTASHLLSAWSSPVASSGTLAAPSLKSSLSGSRFYNEIASISWSQASAAQVSMATSGVSTETVVDWKIGSTEATTDNYATGNTIIVTLEDIVAGSGKAAYLTNATLTTDAGAVTQTTFGKIAADWTSTKGMRLLTSLISNGSSATETDTSANIYWDDARGDVVKNETAENGIDVTTGTARATFSRIHWLG